MDTKTASTSDKLEDNYENDLMNTAETSLTKRPTNPGLRNISVNPETLLLTYRYCHCCKYTTNVRALASQRTIFDWLS